MRFFLLPAVAGGIVDVILVLARAAFPPAATFPGLGRRGGAAVKPFL